MSFMVARTGFDPVAFALRDGRSPLGWRIDGERPYTCRFLGRLRAEQSPCLWLVQGRCANLAGWR